MPRVLYFSSSEAFPAPHAGFTHTYNVVRALSKLGHEVVVVTKSPENRSVLNRTAYEDFILYYFDRSIAYSRPHLLVNLATYPFVLSRIVKKHNVDVIHERFAIPGGVGTMAAKISGVPCILEVNSPFIGRRKAYSDWIGWFDRLRQFKMCDAMVTQTGTLKKILLSKHARKPIYVVPNGVDPEFFNPNLDGDSLKKMYGLQKKKIVLAVSSFRPWHGMEDLVVIASEVNKRNRDICFVVVGEGERFAYVERMVKEYSLETNFLLLGARAYPEIPHILSMADMFIAPFNPYSDTTNLRLYKEHGFFWNPIKIFEYMAMGRPIITTEVGELSKYIKGAGVFAPPGDAKSLASRVLDCFDDPEEMKKMGEEGRRRIIEYYTWEKQVKKLVKIYEKYARERNTHIST